jgi:selenocysteine lyase/cysteine desulfurase
MLCGRLRRGLETRGFEISAPGEPGRSAGIVTCRRPGDDSTVLVQRLTDAAMVCSLRENQLRIAPHFYNTEDEIDRFVDVLTARAGSAEKPAACAT